MLPIVLQFGQHKTIFYVYHAFYPLGAWGESIFPTEILLIQGKLQTKTKKQGSKN